jgi:glutathione S-transferase
MLDTDPLVLYVEAFYTSQWDLACYVALREKNLPFGVSTGFLNQGAGVLGELRAHTMAARVPALQHGDFWLSESLAIVEYLEDAFPPPVHTGLLPANLQKRARARQLSILCRVEVHELREERPSRMIFYPQLARNPKPLGSEAARQAAEVLDAVARLLEEGGPFLFGEFSIADVDVAFVLMRLIKTGHPVSDAVKGYAERVWARPSVREFIAHTRPPNPPPW